MWQENSTDFIGKFKVHQEEWELTDENRYIHLPGPSTKTTHAHTVIRDNKNNCSPLLSMLNWIFEWVPYDPLLSDKHFLSLSSSPSLALSLFVRRYMCFSVVVSYVFVHCSIEWLYHPEWSTNENTHLTQHVKGCMKYWRGKCSASNTLIDTNPNFWNKIIHRDSGQKQNASLFRAIIFIEFHVCVSKVNMRWAMSHGLNKAYAERESKWIEQEGRKKRFNATYRLNTKAGIKRVQYIIVWYSV